MQRVWMNQQGYRLELTRSWSHATLILKASTPYRESRVIIFARNYSYWEDFAAETDAEELARFGQMREVAGNHAA